MSAEAAGSTEGHDPADADAYAGSYVSVDSPDPASSLAEDPVAEEQAASAVPVKRWWWPWGGPRRPVEWSPWLSYFILIWLVDLGFLVRGALRGAPVGDPILLRQYTLQMVGGLFLAVVLTLAVPIALLDASSHRGNRWWLAWLWPVVLVGMIVADVEVGASFIYPLLKVMKSH